MHCWGPCTVLLATLALASMARAAPVPLPPQCAVPDEYVTPDEPLNAVAAALHAGGPLNVLAIGSATTVGQPSATAHGAAPGAAFPFRMADALHVALPNVPVQLTVRGGRGMTAEAMLPLIQQALKARRYQLVLWQTGTVEAVHGVRPDTMQAALQDGIDQVRAAGADLVLVDSQFSRFLRANTDLEPYETVLQEVAALPGVVLFQRFDIMRAWVHGGVIDLERTPKVQRAQAIAQLNTCLGAELAQFVLNGAALK